MKQAPLFVVILLVAFLLTRCGGYSEETLTSFKAGKGYRNVDAVYFLLRYKLYKRSEGIYAFPDGGQGKEISNGIYLMEYRYGDLNTIEKVDGLTGSNDEVWSYRGEIIDNILHFRLREGQLVRISTVQSDYITEESMTFTNNLIRSSYPAEIGLPSPLDSVKKRRKRYIDDLKELNGDYFYRKEIIRQIELNDNEIDDIIDTLHEMDLSMTADDLIIWLNEWRKFN